MVEYAWESRSYSHDSGQYMVLLKSGFKPVKPTGALDLSRFYRKGLYVAHVHGDSLGVVGPKNGLEGIMQQIDLVVKKEERRIYRRAKRREKMSQSQPDASGIDIAAPGP